MSACRIELAAGGALDGREDDAQGRIDAPRRSTRCRARTQHQQLGARHRSLHRRLPRRASREDRVPRPEALLETRQGSRPHPLTYPMGTFRTFHERSLARDGQLVFHAETGAVKRDLVSVYGIDPSRIRVVVPGVDIETFSPDGTRVELGLDEPVIVFLGHDYERKGLDRLLRAMPRMNTSAGLAVVGGGTHSDWVIGRSSLSGGLRESSASSSASGFSALSKASLPSSAQLTCSRIQRGSTCGVSPSRRAWRLGCPSSSAAAPVRLSSSTTEAAWCSNALMTPTSSRPPSTACSIRAGANLLVARRERSRSRSASSARVRSSKSTWLAS